jgi:hypothetical protein
MEQPCYKCGQMVEEGRRFCPHCLAPQIRVVMAEPVPASAPLSDGAVQQIQASVSTPETVPVLAVPTQWSQALKPCALAALVVSVLMLLGLSPFVAMPSVGFLAVVFFRQGRPGLVIKTGAAIRLGAFSGLLCFGLTAVLTALAVTMPTVRAKFHDEILRNAEKWAAARPNDAQIQAAIEQLRTPDGFVAALIVGGVMLLVVSIVLGALGGAVGATIFGRRDRR